MLARFIWLKEGSCKEGNEPYSSLEVGTFFRLWSDHKLPHNGPAGLELLQLQRVCCVVANNLRVFLSLLRFYRLHIQKDAENTLFLNSLGFVFGATAPKWARASSFTRFLDHTQQRTTVGRSPLD